MKRSTELEILSKIQINQNQNLLKTILKIQKR